MYVQGRLLKYTKTFYSFFDSITAEEISGCYEKCRNYHE
jgi:hypothetical protein